MAAMAQSPERQAFITKSIEATQLTLGLPEVKRALGPYHAPVATIMNSLVIPEARDGQMRLARQQLRRNAVPVVALAPGETVTLGADVAGMTRAQRRMASAIAKTWGYTGSNPRLFMWSNDADLMYDVGRRGGLPYTQEANLDAEIVEARFTLKDMSKFADAAPGRAVLLGRPMMGLCYKGGASYVTPTTMIHEAVHVKQVSEWPLRSIGATPEAALEIDRRLELEASYVAGLALDSQIGAGRGVSLRPADTRDLAIRHAVEKHNAGSADFYKPSRALLDDIANQGYTLLVDAHGMPL